MRTICLFLGILFGAVCLEAQGTAELTGLVIDPQKAAVPAVTVTITRVETGTERKTNTNGDGAYSVGALQPGKYEIQLRKEGFQTLVRSDVELHVADRLRLDFELRVGSTADAVTVTAGAEALSATPAIGQVVENKAVIALPLNGRSYVQLAVLAPGTAIGGTSLTWNTTIQNPSPGLSGFFGISGARSDGSEFTLDGITVTTEWLGGTYVYPPPDSIREVRLFQSNYGSEFGYRVGQVVLTSQAGANAFHGAAYEFLRNDALDATNFFNNLAGIGKAHRLRNQFGAALGGPVYLPKYSGKNKTFFFVSYEGSRYRLGNTSTTTLPTALMRAGNFTELTAPLKDPETGSPFPGNVIPSDRLSPIALNTIRLGLYPLPNTAGLANNYTQTPVSSTNIDEVMARLDHNISARDQIWAVGFWETEPNSAERFTQLTGTANEIPVQAYSGHETHTFSSTVLNDVKAGFNFVDHHITNKSPGNLTNAGLGFPQNANQPVANDNAAGISGFSPAGYGGLGLGEALLQYRTKHYVIGDTMSWVSGAHVFKGGAEFVRQHDDERSTSGARGSYSFNGQYSGNAFADFLLGIPSSATRGLFPNGADLLELLLRQNHYAFFLQDDWHVNSRLTLNLGFRYERNTPAVEDRNRQSNYIVDKTGTSIEQIFAPDPTYGRCLCRPDNKDFGPRVGVAYRPGSSERTVVRAGWGLYYYFAPTSGMANLAFNQPAVSLQTVTNTYPSPTFDLANTFLPQLVATTVSAAGMALQRRDGRVQQWTVDLQHDLGHRFLANVTYVGSSSGHLSSYQPLNAALPGPGAFTSRRPYIGPLLNYWTYNATANYQAGTVQIKRAFSNGFLLTSHYTWSKSIDDTSGEYDRTLQNSTYNLSGNRGLSGFNIEHRFVASVIYELPFGKGKTLLRGASGLANAFVSGWSVAPIYTLQSGFPFSVVAATNTANIETGNLRPNLIADPTLSNPTRLQWFNIAAFAQPAAYQFGTAGRNIVIGPGLQNLDIAFTKETALSERLRLHFRGELFNAFNHTNFNTPASTFGSPGFGSISSAGASREVQLALKLLF